MYENSDKIYVVEHAQGAWSAPEYVSTVYGDVQDYLVNEFTKSDLDTGREEDEELFFADYGISETTCDKLNDVFKESNGTGFVITTENVDYVQNCELQVVRRDELSSLCKSDEDAVNKAREMGIEMLDVDELPDNFAKIDDRRSCLLDTKANRLALEEIEKNIPLSMLYPETHNNETLSAEISDQLYKYEMSIITYGTLPEGKNKRPDNFRGEYDEHYEFNGSFEYKCTVEAHDNAEARKLAEEKWDNEDFGDLTNIRAGHWEIKDITRILSQEQIHTPYPDLYGDDGIVNAYVATAEAPQSEIEEIYELNLYVTAYTTFNDDNIQHAMNCIEINGMEEKSADAIRSETIGLLCEAIDMSDKSPSDFLDYINRNCPVLNECAKEAVASLTENEKSANKIDIDDR